MSILEDGTTPVATANTSTVTTASFTPTANSLLVALVSAGNGDGFTSGLGAVTGSAGGGWTRLAGDADAFGGVAEVWVKDAGSSPAAQTVTYTPGGGGPGDQPVSGLEAVVKWYSGARPASLQTGATAVNGGTTSFTKAITAQMAGSVLVLAHASHSQNYTLTANAATTLVGQFNGTGGDTASVSRSTALTSGPGSVTLGYTNTASGDQRMALAEILPAGPVWVASYFVAPGASSGSTLTTASFTPVNGEILVVKMTTWDTTIGMGAPTGGSQAYTSRDISAPAGFHGWAGLYTATVSGSPGPMTVSATPTAAARCALLVERWSNAALATTPATDTSSSAGTSTLTTTAPNSAISWCGLDENSRDPTTRTYAGSAVEDGIDDGHVGSNSVAYFAYQPVAAAGATTYGVTLPTALAINYAAIELLSAGAVQVTPLPPQNVINNRAALARAFNW